MLAEAAELAPLGPVGWIATAAILAAELFLAFGAKSDYELFAAHSFLGYGRGLGSSEPAKKFPWMGELGWSMLKDPQKAQQALIRLVSGFSVWIDYYPYAPERNEKFWWQIKPSYIPDGARFEVEVDFKMPQSAESADSRMSTRKGTIWPDGAGELVMTDGLDASSCHSGVFRKKTWVIIAVKILPLFMVGLIGRCASDCVTTKRTLSQWPDGWRIRLAPAR